MHRPGERGCGCELRQWTEVGTGARSTSRGWGLPHRCKSRAWNGWRCRAEGGQPGGGQNEGPPRPGGSRGPDPGDCARGGAGGSGALVEPAARAEGFAAARGPGRLVSRPPARTSVSSGRRAGRTRRSRRRRRRCRESRRLRRRPDRSAQRLPDPPAAGQSRPYRPERAAAARLGPGPSPPSLTGKEGWGRRANDPAASSRPCPPPPRIRLVILEEMGPARAAPPESPAPRNCYSQKTARQLARLWAL